MEPEVLEYVFKNGTHSVRSLLNLHVMLYKSLGRLAVTFSILNLLGCSRRYYDINRPTSGPNTARTLF